MAKPFSYAFYHSAAWARARESALIRDNHLCQRCLKAGEITPATMVHHIQELTPDNINDPNITCGLDNLVSLCDRCHKITHGWARDGATRQGLAFDDNGNLICLNE
ncbi:HNH endonuclease [Olsenella sp. Marseille-P4559]|uniref:HNH endonuclease n=1 Tax=Olsenella sp. Marseille-P4559 TaxID=2364795 RepID=UPI001031C257|nr:HNH endonuclease [Olsenella sp. Marseille-P4559]